MTGARGSEGRGAPWWRPDRFAARRPRLEARAAVARAVRRVFEDGGFVEVDTPALQVSPGLEPHLETFATELRGPRPDERATRHLHTSPEFAMKKLLAAGMPRIFQLAHVFRNAEAGRLHHPEFTMLEWYRAGADYRDLIDDCRALLTAAAGAAGTGTLRHGGAEADPAAPWEVTTVVEAFRRHAGLDLDPLLPAPGAAADPAPFAAAAAGLGIACAADDRWDDVFFRVFLDRVEPALGLGAPTVLTDFPAPMAALARVSPHDPRIADRFELYVCGVELANAFGELTDAAVQRTRFEADRAFALERYGRAAPIDEDFLAALEHGLPESAGIALGFDRLVMLATGAEDVESVLWAPVAGP